MNQDAGTASSIHSEPSPCTLYLDMLANGPVAEQQQTVLYRADFSAPLNYVTEGCLALGGQLGAVLTTTCVTS